MIMDQDNHFRDFAKVLEGAIAEYGALTEETLLERQCHQMEKLAALEDEFRLTLVGSRYGDEIYKAFISFVCDEKKNILYARPFFRERQVVFTTQIGGALKTRSVECLQKFHINYQFVSFVLAQRRWLKRSKVVRLASQISELRNALAIINMPLAISRARIFWSRTPKSQLSYMDLVQICSIGLLSAIDKFVLPFSRVFRSVIIGRCVGDMIESYSMDRDTILSTCSGKLKKIVDFRKGDSVWGINNRGQVIRTKMIALHDHGMLEGVEVVFNDGYKMVCSINHKFLTVRGMVSLRDILRLKMGVLCEPPIKIRRLESALRSGISDKTETDGAQVVVPGMQRTSEASVLRIECEKQGEVSKPQRVARSLWRGFSNKTEVLEASQSLCHLSGEDCRTAKTDSFEVEARESRENRSGLRYCCVGVCSAITGRSRDGQRVQGKMSGRYAEVEKGESREILRQHATCLVKDKAFQDGGVASLYRHPNMGPDMDSLWRGPQASGFCESRPQDLDRGGRKLPFYRSLPCPSSAIKGPDKGRYVECGSSKPKRCDANQIVDAVLFQRGEVKARMVPVAHSNAPLASTGSLVLRSIVRFRSVGLRHMYDLEVSHPKHNFLLPNGIVTSNSTTLLHFFPSDKRRIYRANKLLNKFMGEQEVNYDQFVEAINEGVDLPHHTTPSEIAGLLAAASTVSTDSIGAGIDSEVEAPSVNRFAAPESCRPDVQYEKQEVMLKLEEAIGRLAIVDQKILKLHGILL